MRHMVLIAVLIGKAPSELSITVSPLTTAIPPIPVSIPSTLVERRPDITIAERSVASANAGTGVDAGVSVVPCAVRVRGSVADVGNGT